MKCNGSVRPEFWHFNLLMFNLPHPFIVFAWHGPFGCLSWDKITSPSNQINLSYSGQRRQRVDRRDFRPALFGVYAIRRNESHRKQTRVEENTRKSTAINSAWELPLIGVKQMRKFKLLSTFAYIWLSDFRFADFLVKFAPSNITRGLTEAKKKLFTYWTISEVWKLVFPFTVFLFSVCKSS